VRYLSNEEEAALMKEPQSAREALRLEIAAAAAMLGPRRRPL